MNNYFIKLKKIVSFIAILIFIYLLLPTNAFAETTCCRFPYLKPGEKVSDSSVVFLPSVTRCLGFQYNTILMPLTKENCNALYINTTFYSHWCCMSKSDPKSQVYDYCRAIDIKGTCTKEETLKESDCAMLKYFSDSSPQINQCTKGINPPPSFQPTGATGIKEAVWKPIPIVTQVEYPGLKFSDPSQAVKKEPTAPTLISVNWMAEFIIWFYKYAIGISAIFAVIMIMYGGVLYIMSGATDKVQQAKDIIKSAVMGLTLIIGAHFILNYVNPQLTAPKPLRFQLPSIDVSASGSVAQKGCEIKGSQPFTLNGDKFCIDFTNGKYVNLHPKQYTLTEKYLTATNYNAIKKDNPNFPKIENVTFFTGRSASWATIGMYNRLKTVAEAMKKIDPGLRLYVNSMSRSISTQQRLCNCYVNYKENLKKGVPASQACTDAKNCGACNLAGAPSCRSCEGPGGHKCAKSIDLRLGGTYKGKKFDCGRVSQKYNCRTEILATKKVTGAVDCELVWTDCQNMLAKLMKGAGFRPIPSEWWHFDSPD